MNRVYLTQEIIQPLDEYLSSDEVPSGCLDYLACHGFICAQAIRFDEFDPRQTLQLVVDAEPLFQSTEEQQLIFDALTSLHHHISRQLYLGDELDLPIELEPPNPGQTNDLTDWCFGFMEAVGIWEEDWFGQAIDIDSVADLILPMSLYSEPHVEPELQHLVKTENLRNKLAGEIPDNLQQLYLLFRD